MRIVVTGGAGFIGSHVTDRYVELGHEVFVIDDLSTGFRENVNPAATFCEIDLCDEQAVEELISEVRPEIINHHAAQMDVRRSVRDPLFDARTNILASVNLIIQAIRSGVRRIVYASSGGACYGVLTQIPAPETHPIRPISQYGVSKSVVENYLYAYSYQGDLPEYTILRYANVYGPRQNPHGEAGVNAVFAGLMLAGKRPTIFGVGDKTRDYAYIGDVAEANVLALERGVNEAINIGTSVQTTDQEVYDCVAAAVGFEEPPIYGDERKGDLRRNALDITKAGELLGWAPTVEFSEGVKRTVAAHRERLASEGLGD